MRKVISRIKKSPVPGIILAVLLSAALVTGLNCSTGDQATIVANQECTIYLPNGTTDSCNACGHIVLPVRGSGKIDYNCAINIPNYDQGEFSQSGFSCSITLPSGQQLRTTKSSKTISAQGKAFLTCSFEE